MEMGFDMAAGICSLTWRLCLGMLVTWRLKARISHIIKLANLINKPNNIRNPQWSRRATAKTQTRRVTAKQKTRRLTAKIETRRLLHLLAEKKILQVPGCSLKEDFWKQSACGHNADTKRIHADTRVSGVGSEGRGYRRIHVCPHLLGGF